MAEVSITGFLDQAVQTTTTTSSAGAKTTTNTVGANLIGQDQIVFGVSEDLGDGLTAYAAMAVFNNTTANGTNLSSDTGSGVGLKGAFGNVFLGNVYSQVWQTMAAADASGWGAGSKGSVWGNTNGVGANSRSIVYTLPSLSAGLDITVEQSYANTSTAVGDASGVSVSYATGALFVKYAASKINVSSGTTTYSSYDGAGTATPTTFDGSQATFQALALTYDLGAAKLYYGAQIMSANDSADVAENKYTYGLTVPFGATTIGWGHSNAVYTNNAGTNATVSGDKIYAKYAFSKRTNGYFAVGKASTTGSQIGLTNTAIGLTHSF